MFSSFLILWFNDATKLLNLAYNIASDILGHHRHNTAIIFVKLLSCMIYNISQLEHYVYHHHHHHHTIVIIMNFVVRSLRPFLVNPRMVLIALLLSKVSWSPRSVRECQLWKVVCFHYFQMTCILVSLELCLQHSVFSDVRISLVVQSIEA
jgi:hypothetical protein